MPAQHIYSLHAYEIIYSHICIEIVYDINFWSAMHHVILVWEDQKSDYLSDHPRSKAKISAEGGTIRVLQLVYDLQSLDAENLRRQELGFN